MDVDTTSGGRFAQHDLVAAKRVLSRSRHAAAVRALSKISDGRAAFAIALQWLIIGTAAFAAMATGHWAVYLAAIVVIATRQQALAVIMHDATHYRLFSNRTVNDVASDLFCAFPLLMFTSGYRHSHLLHHKHVNGAEDPYYRFFIQDDNWRFPKRRGQAVRVLLGDLFGLHIRSQMALMLPWSFMPYLFDRDLKPGLSRAERLRLLGFAVAVTGAIAYTGAWIPVLLLWFLPTYTVAMVILRLRGIAEHPLVPGDELSQTCHVEGTAWERFFISPCNINFHIAHHAFPSVPFYNLPAMQRVLMSDETFRARAKLFPAYFSSHDGIFWSLTGTDGERSGPAGPVGPANTEPASPEGPRALRST